MIDADQLAARQLSRMRGMNRFYHERFFADVRFTTVAAVLLFVVGAWEVPMAYLLIPPIALLGAAQTAFDASYLIFSRHYATTLEQKLNEIAGGRILVAHEMENSYLFPLNARKVVTARFGRDFTWFGFMTLFYTALGVAAFAFGLALGWDTLTSAGTGWTLAYLGTVGGFTITSLAVGWWWFVGGIGEKRLARVLESVAWQEEPGSESP